MALGYLVLGVDAARELASYSIVLNLFLLLLFGIPMLLAKWQLDMLLIFIPFFLLVLQGLKHQTLRSGYIITLFVFTLLVPFNIYKSFKLHRLNYDESTQLLMGTKELHLTDDSQNNFPNYIDFTIRSISKYVSCAGSKKTRTTLKHYHPEWAMKIIPLLTLNVIMLICFLKALTSSRGKLRITFL